MRKTYVLTLLALCGILVPALFYYFQQTRNISRHHAILTAIASAKEANALLNADVLKAQDFLLQDYGPIKAEYKEMEASCEQLRKDSLGLFDRGQDDLGRTISAYCDAVGAKLKAVEKFESLNTELHDSVVTVQEKSHTFSHGKIGDLEVDKVPEAVLDAAISYYLRPNQKDWELLTSFLERKKIPPSERALVADVQKMFQGNDELNGLIRNLLDSPIENDLNRISALYSENYERHERRAAVLRSVLLWVCILLALFVLYGITTVLRAAKMLQNANSDLEARVAARTSELNDSKNLIMQQQQSILTSAKLSALGEMAGGVAHEVNNPLAIIRTVSAQLEEVVGEPDFDPQQVRSMSKVISSTTDRITKIVQGLLAFSRDGQGAPMEPVNVRRLVQDTLGFCQEKFKNHGVDLRLKEIPADLSFDGRFTQISQVLLNVFNNAFDSTEGQPEKWVEVEAMSLPGKVEILVSDSGKGVSAELRKKIFEPFFTTKEIGKGTGMGLSISLGIVRDHGGTIELDPESERTRFRISLPSGGRASE